MTLARLGGRDGGSTTWPGAWWCNPRPRKMRRKMQCGCCKLARRRDMPLREGVLATPLAPGGVTLRHEGSIQVEVWRRSTRRSVASCRSRGMSRHQRSGLATFGSRRSRRPRPRTANLFRGSGPGQGGHRPHSKCSKCSKRAKDADGPCAC